MKGNTLIAFSGIVSLMASGFWSLTLANRAEANASCFMTMGNVTLSLDHICGDGVQPGDFALEAPPVEPIEVIEHYEVRRVVNQQIMEPTVTTNGQQRAIAVTIPVPVVPATSNGRNSDQELPLLPPVFGAYQYD